MLLDPRGLERWPRASAPCRPLPSGALLICRDNKRARQRRASSLIGALLKALYVEYALNAFALVPHMSSWRFVARGLVQGLDAARTTVLSGWCAAGPVLSGLLSDRIGFARTGRVALVTSRCDGLLSLASDVAA